MATLAISATAPRSKPTGSKRAVATCYSALDYFFPACGLFDLTEGMYRGDDSLSYAEAQANQHEYLLDQCRCGPGSRLLDIGCGYGTLLARAKRRGVRGVGITLSAEQVRRGQENGLNLRQADYATLGRGWEGRFDAIVANGSAEHFVQPADAAAGRDDAIYRRFFRIAHRLIDPLSTTGRLATTVIHFERRPDPNDLLQWPWRFPRGSDEFHFALLARGFGGWYPVAGQLERCAAGCFDLIEEVDGTDDYRRTSETWLAQVRNVLHSLQGAWVMGRAVPLFLQHPIQFSMLLYAVLGAESWNWQFRSRRPPTRLLRQTWAYRSPTAEGRKSE